MEEYKKSREAHKVNTGNVGEWNDLGFWEYPCGCAKFQDGWEKCNEHKGRLIASDPSVQQEVVDNPSSNYVTVTPIPSYIGKQPTPIKVGLPTDAKERKGLPIASGVLDYFPDALAEVARVSMEGNNQHNGVGTPLKWDRSKSTDESDALIRHFIDRGKIDSDGQRHSAKVAWRSLALLQKELEQSIG